MGGGIIQCSIIWALYYQLEFVKLCQRLKGKHDGGNICRIVCPNGRCAA